LIDPIMSYLIVYVYLFSLNEKRYASKLDSSIIVRYEKSIIENDILSIYISYKIG